MLIMWPSGALSAATCVQDARASRRMWVAQDTRRGQPAWERLCEVWLCSASGIQPPPPIRGLALATRSDDTHLPKGWVPDRPVQVRPERDEPRDGALEIHHVERKHGGVPRGAEGLPESDEWGSGNGGKSRRQSAARLTRGRTSGRADFFPTLSLSPLVRRGAGDSSPFDLLQRERVPRAAGELDILGALRSER